MSSVSNDAAIRFAVASVEMLSGMVMRHYLDPSQVAQLDTTRRHAREILSALSKDVALDEYDKLRKAVVTPFVSTLTHDAALERLREINQISYGSV